MLVHFWATGMYKNSNIYCFYLINVVILYYSHNSTHNTYIYMTYKFICILNILLQRPTNLKQASIQVVIVVRKKKQKSVITILLNTC